MFSEIHSARQLKAQMESFKSAVFDLTNTPGGRELEAGMSWGEHAEQEQKRQDAYFLQMSDAEWSAHLRTDRSQSVEEIQRLRKMRASPVVEVDAPSLEKPKTSAYWYNEYLNYPEMYFANEAEQKQAIAQVMEEWSVGVGRWRLGALEHSAVLIQRWWAQKLLAKWNRQLVDCPCGDYAVEDGLCPDCLELRTLRTEMLSNPFLQ